MGSVQRVLIGIVPAAGAAGAWMLAASGRRMPLLGVLLIAAVVLLLAALSPHDAHD